MAKLIIDYKKCVGCGLCERNCPNNSMYVINGVPITCLHCSSTKAPCLNTCPTEALYVEPESVIVTDETLCVGCGLCAVFCVAGAIRINERGVAQKCNLCIGRGKPACIEVCPTGAISFTDVNTVASNTRLKRASKIK